jgi:hypothetical protein
VIVDESQCGQSILRLLSSVPLRFTPLHKDHNWREI